MNIALSKKYTYLIFCGAIAPISAMEDDSDRPVNKSTIYIRVVDNQTEFSIENTLLPNAVERTITISSHNPIDKPRIMQLLHHANNIVEDDVKIKRTSPVFADVSTQTDLVDLQKPKPTPPKEPDEPSNSFGYAIALSIGAIALIVINWATWLKYKVRNK